MVRSKKICTTDNELILGKTYLPRKFKTIVIVRLHNDVDWHTNDMNFITVVKNEKIIGFNVLIDSSLSFIHGNKRTWSFLETEIDYSYGKNFICFWIYSDNSERLDNHTDRFNAKTRYTINNLGLNIFKR